MSKEREPLFMIAIGKKGVGKTERTKKIITPYTKGVPKNNVPPRKVLIFDINNEYTQFEPIGLSSLYRWTFHPEIECRRILPFHEENRRKMSIGEVQHAFEKVLDTFKGGLLIVEDPAKYTTPSATLELSGTLSTNRHVDCDVLMHFQSVGRAATPYIKSNMNRLRFHKCLDTVERHENKFKEQAEILYIAENIVDGKYAQYMHGKPEGQTFCPFYVDVDFDRFKINGDFTKEEFATAVAEYLDDHDEKVEKLKRKKDRKTGKPLYNHASAFDKAEADLISIYYGNKK